LCKTDVNLSLNDYIKFMSSTFLRYITLYILYRKKCRAFITPNFTKKFKTGITAVIELYNLRSNELLVYLYHNLNFLTKNCFITNGQIKI